MASSYEADCRDMQNGTGNYTPDPKHDEAEAPPGYHYEKEVELTYSGSRGGTNDMEVDVPTGRKILVPDKYMGNNAGCFIATTVYGDINAPEVQTLRDFRDNVLMKSRLGRQLVGFYYSGAGEKCADFIGTQVPSLRPLIRKGLDKLVQHHQKGKSSL